MSRPVLFCIDCDGRITSLRKLRSEVDPLPLCAGCATVRASRETRDDIRRAVKAARRRSNGA